MTALPHIHYFLGANSPTGFYSLYDHLLSPEEARAIYILKGGPGCGKSTLMRKIGAWAQEAGLEPEYILCSGDPDSLDAVVLPTLSVAIVDGTAPHVVEPKYPGAVERYVNMGDCYDQDALWPLRQEIMDCMSGYKGCYQRAYRCLGAAAEIMEDQRSALLTEALSQKLAKRAQGILVREIPRRKSEIPGRVKLRFLDAVTHKGFVSLYGTALAQCSRIYALSDSAGLAHELLIHLLAGATANGYDVVACPDPMAPDRLAHLLIPQLDLAFLSAFGTQPEKAYRRLRLDAAADSELLRRNRPRLRFAKKVSAALVEEAVSSLALAKEMHDDLEAIYNPHVDFGLVDGMAQDIWEEIVAL
ncbi:hypothetical protein [Pseudoflavonifractor sp. 60]|uniref:hypothetical protein n=1 Tax=Pseudoflavonifractor sp. 60 TaxID=2304576 RepID=UPI001FAE6BCA|nr:hypothetical protein [Pseudoflavonifractor sp. 60]